MSDSVSLMELVVLVLGILFFAAIFVVTLKHRLFLLSSRNFTQEDFKYYDIRPLHKSLMRAKEPNPKLLSKYAEDIEKRALLLECLTAYDRSDLFPKDYHTPEKLGLSYIAKWLDVHDDYDSVPDAIEYCDTLTLKNGTDVLVFKFKSYEPHLLANKGWMFGYVSFGTNDQIKPEFIYSDFSKDKMDPLVLEAKILKTVV